MTDWLRFSDVPALIMAGDGQGDHGRILMQLFIVLLAAKLAAELFERLKQPAVVGEIVAGILVGPSLLNVVQPGVLFDALAEIGVVFLLFSVGLETRPSDLFKVRGTAIGVAVLGVIVPFAAGWALLSLWPGYSGIEAVFLGAAMVATSVGITARVLSGLGLISSDASRVILAAAVIDDIIGLLVLAVVSGIASGEVHYAHIAITAVMAISFTLLMVAFGSRAVRRIEQPVARLKIGHSWLIFSLMLCFGMAAIASEIGIAGIVGAFLAGVALSEATDRTPLHMQAQTLTEFTAPFFLVNIGIHLNLSVFGSREVITMSAVVVVLAILTKLFGCALAAARLGRRRAIQIGVGMIPRGEVGIVVAQIGLALAVVSDAIYGVVLAMAVATTLAAPPFIRLAFSGEPVAPTPPEQARELEHNIS
jgi:Kef-type K+ transport system membrane component KefB